MFTRCPAQASSASASDGRPGQGSARLRERELGDQARRCRRVVSHDQLVVGGPLDVELHAVGAELQRPAKGSDGVLRGFTVRAPVGEDESHVNAVLVRAPTVCARRPKVALRIRASREAVRRSGS